MNEAEVFAELASLGDERTCTVWRRHGAPEPLYGVKVADLKKLARRIRGDHELIMSLYASGQPDAQYLAGIVADPARMSDEDIDAWAHGASWYMVAEYSVPGVAASHPSGWDAALRWIDSDRDGPASAGWATLTGIVSIREDDDLDLSMLAKLMDRVRDDIADAGNRTRYTMNGFVIAVGCYVESLSPQARAMALEIGKVVET